MCIQLTFLCTFILQGCDYITLSKDRLREHSNVHAEKELCPVCNKSVCKGKAMKTHMRNHADPSVTCEKCGGSFKNRHSLKVRQNKDDL